MKYKDLLSALQAFTPEQLELDVTIGSPYEYIDREPTGYNSTCVINKGYDLYPAIDLFFSYHPFIVVPKI